LYIAIVVIYAFVFSREACHYFLFISGYIDNKKCDISSLTSRFSNYSSAHLYVRRNSDVYLSWIFVALIYWDRTTPYKKHNYFADRPCRGPWRCAT